MSHQELQVCRIQAFDEPYQRNVRVN